MYQTINQADLVETLCYQQDQASVAIAQTLVAGFVKMVQSTAYTALSLSEKNQQLDTLQTLMQYDQASYQTQISHFTEKLLYTNIYVLCQPGLSKGILQVKLAEHYPTFNAEKDEWDFRVKMAEVTKNHVRELVAHFKQHNQLIANTVKNRSIPADPSHNNVITTPRP